MEAVRVEFDPDRVSYKYLLQVFFSAHNPAPPAGANLGQFDMYRSKVFYNSPEQKKEALEMCDVISEHLGRKVQTWVVDVAPFYMAEDYQQQYYLKHKMASCLNPNKFPKK